MTESALKFGPEWLRALSHGSTVASPPPSPGLPKYKLAEHRYGREEMLALFDKNVKIPEDLAVIEGLVTNKPQLPLALVATTEEEQMYFDIEQNSIVQRTWARSVNSDAVLRLMGRGSDRVPSSTSTRGGRGISSERGRGRGRGLFYQRGTTEEVTDGPPGGYSRPRPFERSQSMHERSQSWEEKEKERRFEKGHTDAGRSFDMTWRRDRETEDESGWRMTTSRDRNNWRTCEKEEKEHDRDFDRDRSNDIVHNREANEKPFMQSKSRKNKSWDGDHDGGGDKLPEWSTDDNGDVGFVGTFDSSGAFLENKLNDIHVSGIITDCSETKRNSVIEKDHKESNSKIQDTNTKNVKRDGENSVGNCQTKRPNNLIRNSQQATATTISDADNNATTLACQPPSQRTPPVMMNCVRKSPLSVVSAIGVAEEPDISASNNSASLRTNVSIVDVNQTLLPKPHINRPAESVAEECRHQPPPSMQMSSVKDSVSGAATLSRGSSENDRADDVNFDHLEKAAENLVAKWTAEEDEKAAQKEQTIALPMHHEDALNWFYRDPQGQVQGPFTATEMAEWFNARYFTMNLLVRRGCDEKFSLLGDLIKHWGRIPFNPGPNPPPLMNISHPQPALNAEIPAMPPQMPGQERLFLLQQQIMQQHLLQQQMLQHQLFIRHQAHVQQLMSIMKDQEGSNNLTAGQQQQILLQQLLSQQLQQLPARPPGQEVPLPDIVQQLQRLANLNPTPSKDEILNAWSSLNSSLNLWNARNKQQGNSVWDLENGPNGPDVSAVMMQEIERKRKEEEERLAEEEKQNQLQEQQQQQMIQEKEEWKKMEEAKREEALRLKREEELLKQKQEEEKMLEELRKEKERQMLEEQRKLEEEEKRKMEEERKRREEERKRKEEEKRKKEEKKRQEEEQKRKEAEIELQRQKEIEQERALQQQRELQARQELQKQEIQRQQMEALMKLEEKQKAEKAKAQHPAWAVQTVQTNTIPSLSEIQKMQEEKNRQEREEQRRLAQSTQPVVPQSNLQQQQKQNANLTWAQKPTISTNPVKSLLEIQKEETEKMAMQHKILQQTQQNKQQNVPNLSLMTAGVWGNASSNLSWTAAPQANSWSMESVPKTSASGSGFWDEAMNASNARKSSSCNKTTNDKIATVNKNAVPATSSANNKNKTARTKKEEDTVMKIFGSHSQNADDFTQWCTQALGALQSSVDIPTFVSFLKDVESSFEVQDYVRSYLGENKEARDFAKQFLERRSKYRNQSKLHNEENMWGPAPAVNPLASRSQSNLDYDGQKGGTKKKKKNKMHKVDSSILGFTVHASIDRINVGEIEHLEGV